MSYTIGSWIEEIVSDAITNRPSNPNNIQIVKEYGELVRALGRLEALEDYVSTLTARIKKDKNDRYNTSLTSN